jgi:hypothetical protein
VATAETHEGTPSEPDEAFIRSEEMEWLSANRREMERTHAGRWVALSGNRLIATGMDARTVFLEAINAGFPRPFITCIRRPVQRSLRVPHFRLEGPKT